MLELLLTLAIVAGVLRARHARHWSALTAGLALSYLLFADTLAAVADDSPQQVYDLMSQVILGPGASRFRVAAALPLPPLMLQYPLLVRGLRIAVASLVAWRCLHEGAQRNPLLPRAHALDQIALAFAGAASIDAVEVALIGYAIMLGVV